MKKILIVQHYGSIGGSGISLLATLEVLSSYYNIVIYVPENPPDLLNLLRKKGYTAKTFNFRIGTIRHFSGGNSIFDPKFWFHFMSSFFQFNYWKKIIEKEEPDLIIVNSMVLAWMSLISKHRKSICFVRETMRGRRNSPINVYIRKLLDKFSLVFFLSEYDLRNFGLKKAEVSVCPDFVTSDNNEISSKTFEREELGLKNEDFVLLYLGGISKLKGIHVLLKAMKYLKGEHIKLIILGNHYSQLQKNKLSFYFKNFTHLNQIFFSVKVKHIIKKDDISENIIFLGLQEDVKKFYKMVDAVVIPITKPHQARPVFEAGLFKKPVIITDFECNCENVKNNQNGITFPKNNYEALAKAILKLKNDQDLTKELGEANFLLTQEKHLLSYVKTIMIEHVFQLIDQ